MLEEKWEAVNLQTGWSLEKCTKPGDGIAVQASLNHSNNGNGDLAITTTPCTPSQNDTITVTRCDSKLMPQKNSTTSSTTLHDNQDRQSNASLSPPDDATTATTAPDNITMPDASDSPPFLEQ